VSTVGKWGPLWPDQTGPGGAGPVRAGQGRLKPRQRRRSTSPRFPRRCLAPGIFPAGLFSFGPVPSGALKAKCRTIGREGLSDPDVLLLDDPPLRTGRLRSPQLRGSRPGGTIWWTILMRVAIHLGMLPDGGNQVSTQASLQNLHPPFLSEGSVITSLKFALTPHSRCHVLKSQKVAHTASATEGAEDVATTGFMRSPRWRARNRSGKFRSKDLASTRWARNVLRAARTACDRPEQYRRPRYDRSLP